MNKDVKTTNKEKTSKKKNLSSPVTNPSAQNVLPSSKKGRKSSSAVNSAAINDSPLNRTKISEADSSINKTREIVAKINDINLVKSSNKMYGGYLTNTLSPAHRIVDYMSVISDLNINMRSKSTANELISVFNNIFTSKLH
ncbi:MAG: hypothetical protein II085_03455, partial [Alphaproteobacteria bacterium]|nr:hypothetical protein [Alphaproteobacteria bacterium]